MKREIDIQGEKIQYQIKLSRRVRHMRMTIGLTEGLVVAISHPWHEQFVEDFLRQKSTWILRHMRRIKEHEGKIVIKHSKDEYEKNKKQMLALITERVEFFNTLYKFPYNHISIRNQTSLWGSCTRQGNLQFNYKLSYLPQQAIDYVVVHELCHLKEHNHGEKFWELVSRVIPDYKAIRKSLRGYIMQEG